MQQWEYCEVTWAPKLVTIHVYSSREQGTYEGVQQPQEWGALLAQLGADGWELVGVAPARPAHHSLYYFKRPIDSSAKAEWEEQQERLRQQTEEYLAQRKQHTVQPIQREPQ
jgi:hypothetical protein